jgi:hypothetical protein
VAWINATPEPAPQTGKPRPQAPGRPRREDIEAAGGYVPMPSIEQGKYLVDLLFRWGPGKSGGPLDAPDIKAWCDLEGMELHPWETLIVHRLSQAYVAEMQQAMKHDAPPPWPDAVPMWRWVRNQKAERALDKYEERQARQQKRKARNGDRQ